MKADAVFAAIDGVVTQIFKWICVAAFSAIALLVTANVFLRFVPITSLNWYSEIVELCFAWMVFYGAAAVWMVKGHFSAGDWIGKRLKSPGLHAAYRLLVDIVAFAFVAIFFRYSVQLVNRALEVTESLQFPKKVIYLSMPISSGFMVLYSLKFIVLGIIDVAKKKTAG